jgi:hypothetical protein
MRRKTCAQVQHMRIQLMTILAVGSLSLADPQLAAQVQMPMVSASGGFNASLARFFGPNQAFSAQAEAVIRMRASKETSTIPMEFALLNGRIRMELDLTRIKSKPMTPEAVNMVKQMGLSRMTSIISPDKKVIYVVYPSLKAYVELPLNEDREGVGNELKIETSEAGSDTAEGHPCAKRKVVVTDQKGRKQEGFTWNATDLKGFPVKMEFMDGDATITLVYRNIKLTPPDATAFEAPAGFTKHEDMQALMLSASQKGAVTPAPR